MRSKNAISELCQTPHLGYKLQYCKVNYWFIIFALLLSSVLDGFDQLIKLFLHCPKTKQCTLSINLGNIKNFYRKNFLEMPRIEPGLAGWEAQMLPLCYADPLYCANFY